MKQFDFGDSDMYNSQLTVFVCVADNGSFTKAAEKLYISSTAVMKQMNALEEHLGVTLLERTNHGIQLTAGGEVIYRDAKHMMEESRRSVAEAKAAMSTREQSFCVGTSLLNPAKPFMDLWFSVGQEFAGYKLQLVPFEDDHTGILREISGLGTKFDFLVGVCDSRLWLEKCQMYQLGYYKKMCAVPRTHRLASKKILQLSDLYGETLMMVKEGDSGINDFLRHDLQKNHPQIHIEDTAHFYDITVFNRCVETGNVLLTIECWQDVHPALVSIPVDWNYRIPYGLLYAKHPAAHVQRFVDALKSESEHHLPADSTY